MNFSTALKIQLKLGCAFILSFFVAGILRWGYYPFLDRLFSYDPYVIGGGIIGLIIGAWIRMHN